MKNSIVHMFALLLISMSVNFASCQSTGSSKNKSEGNTTKTINEKLPAEDFEKRLSQLSDVQLIDVRTPGEYAGGHLENAVNYNFYNDSFKSMVQKLEKNKPVFVYCATGVRSGNTAALLAEIGVAEIYDLKGGYKDWVAKGKKVVR